MPVAVEITGQTNKNCYVGSRKLIKNCQNLKYRTEETSSQLHPGNPYFEDTSSSPSAAPPHRWLRRHRCPGAPPVVPAAGPGPGHPAPRWRESWQAPRSSGSNGGCWAQRYRDLALGEDGDPVMIQLWIPIFRINKINSIWINIWMCLTKKAMRPGAEASRNRKVGHTIWGWKSIYYVSKLMIFSGSPQESLSALQLLTPVSSAK